MIAPAALEMLWWCARVDAEAFPDPLYTVVWYFIVRVLVTPFTMAFIVRVNVLVPIPPPSPWDACAQRLSLREVMDPEYVQSSFSCTLTPTLEWCGTRGTCLVWENRMSLFSYVYLYVGPSSSDSHSCSSVRSSAVLTAYW